MIDEVGFFANLMQIFDYKDLPAPDFIELVDSTFQVALKGNQMLSFDKLLGILQQQSKSQFQNIWDSVVLGIVELTLDANCAARVLSANEKLIVSL